MSNQICVVVIPVHASEPTVFELISFKQCFRILGNHPIKIIAPKKLNLESYKDVVPDFEVVYIDEIWQSSLLNYNKLKLSQFFYTLFSEYEFMLTYELDAFVFKDELIEWCQKGYDYIGAPWFKDFEPNGNEILGVGNSGFSLRNIKKTQNNLKFISYKDPAKYCVGRIRNILAYAEDFILNILNYFTFENLTIQHSKILSEDLVIWNKLGRKSNLFQISTIDDSYKFSFETNPSFLFILNNQQLPFGCHAWWRYDFEFWKPHIESFGYSLDK